MPKVFKPEPKKCTACLGSGENTKGAICRICKGSGKYVCPKS